LNVIVYKSKSGDSPFEYWLTSLQDKSLVGRIWRRIIRIQEGNLGDHKYISSGVWELRTSFGGGNKGSQQRDILRAVKIWQMFLEE
jgi:putative component of toxin-antitoxin plasmid stabilization module